MVSTAVVRGEVLYHRFPSGGGHGDPFDRDADAVANDVRNGKVTRDHAAGEYGVVVGESGEVDADATESTRAALRSRSSDLGATELA
jgi:N-methylhydantoinase B